MKFDETLIKKAVKEFNDWQGDAVIMCDEEDGEVWTDVFVDENSWKKGLVYYQKSSLLVFQVLK